MNGKLQTSSVKKECGKPFDNSRFFIVLTLSLIGPWIVPARFLESYTSSIRELNTFNGNAEKTSGVTALDSLKANEGFLNKKTSELITLRDLTKSECLLVLKHLSTERPKLFWKLFPEIFQRSDLTTKDFQFPAFQAAAFDRYSACNSVLEIAKQSNEWPPEKAHFLGRLVSTISINEPGLAKNLIDSYINGDLQLIPDEFINNVVGNWVFSDFSHSSDSLKFQYEGELTNTVVNHFNNWQILKRFTEGATIPEAELNQLTPKDHAWLVSEGVKRGAIFTTESWMSLSQETRPKERRDLVCELYFSGRSEELFAAIRNESNPDFKEEIAALSAELCEWAIIDRNHEFVKNLLPYVTDKKIALNLETKISNEFTK
jgi:hypothetical protein